MKKLFIAEKPSVAEEFAKVMGEQLARRDGYREGEHVIVTWCFGHLVTMSLPDEYDEKYKSWRLDTLPFLPETYRYKVIESGSSKKQFATVKALLNREDVDTIYVCTDSGREGEYIYRLVRQLAGVHGKEERRVWINSQTEEEIRRGIEEAKPLSAYDNLSDAAYLRAKIDYLMGMNFSRLLSVKYSRTCADFLGRKHVVVAVGRVMTCVLGMVVKREREIRQFVKTPFYRVVAQIDDGSGEGEPAALSAGRLAGDGVSDMAADGADGAVGKSAADDAAEPHYIECEWRAVEGSAYVASPLLYKENGFKEEKDAQALIEVLRGKRAVVESISRKQEKKNAPLLYNLAELQNECARLFKIAPDQTLAIVQELYEKKLVTYPRTDARVLSSAIAKEIAKNIRGLGGLSELKPFVEEILSSGSYRKIAKTRYVNDAQITDHYAIIPTGAGLGALKSVSKTAMHVYEVIARRFLAIFLPQAVYKKSSLVIAIQPKALPEGVSGAKAGAVSAGGLTAEASGVSEGAKSTGTPPVERLFSGDKYLVTPGYLAVMNYSFTKDKPQATGSALEHFKKGSEVPIADLVIRTGETTPPKRYTTGSIILAMENAGNLIEDESLREEISGSGIGTSATRAEILDKLLRDDYLRKNEKTQILTPSLQGELVFYVVAKSVKSLLNPELTAGWERGLTYVTQGTVTEAEYMAKIEDYITKWVSRVRAADNERELLAYFNYAKPYHEGEGSGGVAKRKSSGRSGKARGGGTRRRTTKKAQ